MFKVINQHKKNRTEEENMTIKFIKMKPRWMYCE
jgi:hypothetical protein